MSELKTPATGLTVGGRDLGRRRGRSGSSARLATMWTLIGPALLVYLGTVVASQIGGPVAVQGAYALVSLVAAVGLQIFTGTSGVLSFGHIAFTAVGAWAYGLLTIDPTLKKALLPDLFSFLADVHAPWPVALAVATTVGGFLAFAVAPFLMRLNGLQAGIATFGLLMVVGQVLTYWSSIGPRSGQAMVGVPADLPLERLVLVAIGVIIVSWVYQHARTARLLRATREDLTAAPGSGINVTIHRVIAFTISGAVCGLGGGLWAATNRVVQSSHFGVGMTFTIIAILVLGGTRSLWGAVLGTLVWSALDSLLVYLQGGVTLGDYVVSIPEGARPIILGATLIVALMVRPDGLTGGRELTWPVQRWRRRG
ncbi:branched-chain amino acid ABC transporter permease [Terrabacter tumescens]|uniref:Branched-chain amino acid ABC transporter permease n=1 Tax=Terrabacter tumescens TaxID=60443 RepID=A0ABQ2I518_9MICO|nr:branched-chain amino acid ABC transporter permease [Terrabacter tumescens]GGM98508.1 branched-chain amino acid ABC transporter permease [Terrabacter tumescens]